MDATDGAAWFGAITGGLSLLATVLTHLDNRKGPVREKQRALRSELRSDVETVLTLIKQSEVAVHEGSGPMELTVGQPASEPLKAWIAKGDQFTSPEVLTTLTLARVGVEHWEIVGLVYDSAARRLDRAVAMEAEGGTPERTKSLKLSRELAVRTTELEQAAQAARTHLEQVLSTLTALDKKP